MATPLTSRRELLASATCAAAGSMLHGQPNQPPNVVLILLDDLGWTDLGCYGTRYYETPNIDGLAAQGTRFTNFYAAAALCSPTRASIMTGKYPARVHITEALPGKIPSKPDQKFLSAPMPPGLSLDETTLADRFRSAGYATALVGKWHLGSGEYAAEHRGFDTVVGSGSAFMPKSQFYPNWSARPGGIVLDGKPGDYLTDRLTDEAVKVIHSHKSRPFFLYFAHYAVHTPLGAKEELLEKWRRKTDPSNPQHNPVYAAMIESVDQSVGRVLQALKEAGIDQRTIVMFASDNGGTSQVQRYTPDPLPPTSNLPLRAGKATFYEGGIRVPFIVRWPALRKPAKVCDTPVISADICPTLLELAGVRRASEGVDGVSLARLLSSGAQPARRSLYWYFPHYDFRPAGAVRAGNFKLVEYYDDNSAELYDLARDIGERNNLAASMPRKVEELRDDLRRWLKSVGAQVMEPNPAYRPSA